LKTNKTLFALILTILFTTIACSTKKNTASSRFYHSLTARYNTYFNGHEAYKSGIEQMEKGNKDNYFTPLPLYLVGNKKTIGLGSGMFDRAIEKSQKAVKQHSIKSKPKRKAGKRKDPKYQKWMAQKEYNPFLYKPWLLMGKAQFQKGEFLEATSTFSYIARLYKTDPKVSAMARVWLARCYAEIGWFYDAEESLTKANSNKLPTTVIPAYASSYCNYLLKQERFKEAIPYLLSTIKNEKEPLLKARQYYILGQIYQLTGEKEKAYKAYKRATKRHSSFELAINAQIKETEVLPNSEMKKTVKRLQKMANNKSNKDYIENIYYALGNTYMSVADTARTIQAYQKGIKLSSKGGLAKATILLALGNIYWTQQRYVEAQVCYTELMGLIDKEHKSYATIDKRSAILEDLVVQVKEVQLQDSLQRVASMDKEEQMQLIDRLINEVMEEERLAKEEEQLALKKEQRDKFMADNPNLRNQTTTPTTNMPIADKSWYFYNTQLVAQGKNTFKQRWGNRKLEDNWRRHNKMVVAIDQEESYDYDEKEETDSLTEVDPKAAKVVEASNDNKNPAFYLKNLPTTKEQIAASNKLIMNAMFEIGMIYKDKLEDLSLAQTAFEELIHRFPDFPKMDEVYYQLYLMNAGRKQQLLANQYKELLTLHYPKSNYTLMINNPDFIRDAVYGKHLEDSLYAATYTAYTKEDYSTINANYQYALKKYPMGQHLPKFMFLHCMSLLENKQTTAFLTELKKLVTAYPTNEITELASHIIKGLQNGRLLAEDSGPLGSIWKRSNRLSKAGTAKNDSTLPPFTVERKTPYLLVLAYEKGKINENLLLYEVARYNFSNFVLKDFTLNFQEEKGIGMLKIGSFNHFEAAYRYQKKIYSDKTMAHKLSGLRAIIISTDNLERLLTYYSFDDYNDFYKKQFSTIEVKELDIPYTEQPLRIEGVDQAAEEDDDIY